MVHNSKARIKALEQFIIQNVCEERSSFEVSDVKRDGTVFVRFRSITEVSATHAMTAFQDAMNESKKDYVITDVNKVRLPLAQF